MSDKRATFTNGALRPGRRLSSAADSSPQLCPSLGAAVASAEVDTAVAVGPGPARWSNEQAKVNGSPAFRLKWPTGEEEVRPADLP